MEKPYFITLRIFALGFSAFFLSCGRPKIEVNPIQNSVAPADDTPIALNVYIENSGSMDGYMCDGSQLKDAVYDYVSELDRYTASTNLYYINKQIIPFNGPLEGYIKNLNPIAFKQAGGNRSSSDIGAMIDSILCHTADSTISLFISDCILDLPAGQAQDFLTNRQIQIKNKIINQLKVFPDLGIEILRFTSDFNGKYFYPTGGFTQLNGVKRPYYIWILGSRHLLARLNAEIPFSDLEKYGLEGTVAFTADTQAPFEIKNRSLTGSTINPLPNGYPATILADFRTTLQPAEAIQAPSNYTVDRSAITIDGIYPIQDKRSSYTHYILITLPKEARAGNENLYFNAPSLPTWISESNDESGTNINANLDKTTGIRSLIQGVADAYKKTTVVTSFRFTIKHR